MQTGLHEVKGNTESEVFARRSLINNSLTSFLLFVHWAAFRIGVVLRSASVVSHTMLRILGLKRHPQYLRQRWTVRMLTAESSSSEFVEIGDIKIAVNTPKSPELVPSGNLHYWGKNLDDAPAEVVGHLRWIAQKSLLGQDIFLTGPPTANRRRLILTLAELCGWECEYLMITKDTTEADLKQRREIVGDSVVWCDAAPVRAAINGRVLIIDGMENAERNVLPTINNLLENREMMLEDGRFLMKGDTIASLRNKDSAASAAGGAASTVALTARSVPVHPSFRVVALGLPVPPYHGRVLDPPLRSRFQSRFVDELTLDDALNCVDTAGFTVSGGVTSAGPSESLKAVAAVYEGLRVMRGDATKDGAGAAAVPCLSVDGLRHCLNLLRPSPTADSASQAHTTSVVNALSRSLPLGYAWRSQKTHVSDIALGASLSQKHKSMLNAMVEKVRSMPVSADATAHVLPQLKEALRNATAGGKTRQLTGQQQSVLAEISQDLALGRNICLHGGKGSGKSYLLAEIAARFLQQDMLVFPVFQEMSGRDLLQRRGTSANSGNSEAKGAAASSLWLDSPLVKAARQGLLCVLDGIDRVDAQALLGIRSIVSSPTYLPPDADTGFPGGPEQREIDLPSGERLRVHPDFRLVGLGAQPVKSEDARTRYLNADLNLSFHLLPDMAPSDIARVLREATSLHVDAAHSEQLQRIDKQIVTAVEALYGVAGKQHPELRPSLRHAQRIQSTLRTMVTASNDNTGAAGRHLSAEESGALVHRLFAQALLIRFLPTASAAKFESAMTAAGMLPAAPSGDHRSNKFMKFIQKATSASALVRDKPRAINISTQDNTVTIGDVTASRRASLQPELVPQPLFHENASHLAVLEALLLSYKASYQSDEGEKAVLLIGNQGVGKNKLVDRLLQVGIFVSYFRRRPSVHNGAVLFIAVGAERRARVHSAAPRHHHSVPDADPAAGGRPADLRGLPAGARRADRARTGV
jgi:MoxR-like ATPase